MADFAKGSTCSQCGTEIKRDVDGGDCWPASRPGYLRQVHENCVPGHLKKFPDDVIGPWYHPDTELPASDKYNLVWHSSSPPFYSSQTAADLQDLAGFSSQEPYYPLGATGTSKDKRASSSVPTTLTRTNNVPGATANYPLHSPAHTDDQNDDELPVDLSSIDGTTSRYYSAYPTPVKYSSTRDTPGSYAVAHDDKVQIAGLTTHVDPAPGYDGSSSGWGRRVRPASVVSGVSVGSAHPSYISNDSTRSRANND